MPHYLIRFGQKPDTWAKLIDSPEDRRKSVEALAASVGGNLVGYWYAFGEADGLLELEVDPHHTGLNRLAPGRLDGRTATRVPVLRGAAPLGALLRGRRVTLVKIDVEGAEVQVLRGLREFLARERHPKVVVEITPRFLAEFGTSRDELYALMCDIGYAPRLNHRCDQFDELFTLSHEESDIVRGRPLAA